MKQINQQAKDIKTNNERSDNLTKALDATNKNLASEKATLTSVQKTEDDFKKQQKAQDDKILAVQKTDTNLQKEIGEVKSQQENAKQRT